MNHIVTYLESKNAIFHGALVLMILYVPHAGALFVQLEHLDMSFSGFTFLNWLYGVGLAAVIEFLILLFLINFISPLIVVLLLRCLVLLIFIFIVFSLILILSWWRCLHGR